MTGVIHFTAIFIASMADQKQSAGLCAARIGMGASPWRPKSAMRRSACSVFVGMPVDGPPRCTFTMTSGSSMMTARPIISDLSARPGAERGADAGDLGLGLVGDGPVLLEVRHRLEDLGRGRDRVAAEEHPAAAQ